MAALVSLIKPEITKLWKDTLARATWIRSLKTPATSIRVFQEEFAASPALQAALPRNATANVHVFADSNQHSYWLRITPSQVYCEG